MRFIIEHLTQYKYSNPVFLEPHTFRLRPREHSEQRLLFFDLNITPAPEGVSKALDPEGNSIHRAWFNNLTDHLTISVNLEVDVLTENPFDFLLSDEAQSIPFTNVQHPLLTTPPAMTIPEPVSALAKDIAERTNFHTLDFLMLLTREIHSTFEHQLRDEGPPKSSIQTLSERKGACRDLAILFIDVCRSQGLAARFVSGFQQGNPKDRNGDLHAWAEVYLPGGGWRGYDPTQGLAVADRHVAVAASITPAETMPVTGTLRGSHVESTMENHLRIQVH